MATTDSNLFIRNATNRLTFPIMDTDNVPVTAAGSPDSERSLEGAAFADCTNEATEIATSSGVYFLDLTVAECTGDQLAYLIKSTSVNRVIIPDVVPALDSGIAQSGAATSIRLRAAASAVNDYYVGANVSIIRGSGAGQVRVITAYVGSNETATVDRAWATNPSSTSVYVVQPISSPSLDTSAFAEANIKAIDDRTDAATALMALYRGGLTQGTIDDASPSDDNFNGDNALSSDNDSYVGQLLIMTTGAQAGDAERILTYVGSSQLITLRAALPAAPANGDAFVILGRII